MGISKQNLQAMTWQKGTLSKVSSIGKNLAEVIRVCCCFKNHLSIDSLAAK